MDGPLIDRQFRYPGSRGDYLRQALRFTVSVLLAAVVICLMLLGVDFYFLGRKAVGPYQFILLLVLGGALGFFSVMMALSLSRFTILVGERDFTVQRGFREIRIPYERIAAIERIRIPGWWPLRADMKSRGETARNIIRIRLKRGLPLTFISGLAGEEDLIGIIRRSAGLEETL